MTTEEIKLALRQIEIEQRARNAFIEVFVKGDNTRATWEAEVIKAMNVFHSACLAGINMRIESLEADDCGMTPYQIKLEQRQINIEQRALKAFLAAFREDRIRATWSTEVSKALTVFHSAYLAGVKTRVEILKEEADKGDDDNG